MSGWEGRSKLTQIKVAEAHFVYGPVREQERLMKLTTRKTILTARRDAIHADLAMIRHELEASQPQSISGEHGAVIHALGQAGQAELEQIESALQRIAGGDYGVCTCCGAVIPAERLDSLPDILTCTGCQSRGLS